MRCLLCYTLVPEDDDECPKCHDNVGRWRRLDQYADQLAREGAAFLRGGDLPRAALALIKASVLAPSNSSVLHDLALVLSQQGLTAEPLYYLKRAEEAAEDGVLRQSIRDFAASLCAKNEADTRIPSTG